LDEGMMRTHGKELKRDDFIQRYHPEYGDTYYQHVPSFDGRPAAISLLKVMKEIYTSLKDKSPLIWGSQQAVPEVLEGVDEWIPGSYGIHRSRLPTTKPSSSGPSQHTEDWLLKYNFDTKEEHKKMKGSIVKHPEQRKRALAYIRDLREIGREAGRELGDSLLSEEKTSRSNDALEERISSVITIAGLGAGIFFLSSNITGNAIADLSTKKTSFLGAGLLVVGLVAGFFWVKSRKK
jgi:hypothetical protein